MKIIALIMAGWKRFFTYAWPAGILQKIRDRGRECKGLHDGTVQPSRLSEAGLQPV